MLKKVFQKAIAINPSRLFASEVSTKVEKVVPKKDIQFYREGQLQTRSSLILKKEQDIDEYAVNVVRNYFRCLNKANVTQDSNLIDHGLDSLDSIEISMQVSPLFRLKKTWAIKSPQRPYLSCLRSNTMQTILNKSRSSNRRQSSILSRDNQKI